MIVNSTKFQVTIPTTDTYTCTLHVSFLCTFAALFAFSGLFSFLSFERINCAQSVWITFTETCADENEITCVSNFFVETAIRVELDNYRDYL